MRELRSVTSSEARPLQRGELLNYYAATATPDAFDEIVEDLAMAKHKSGNLRQRLGAKSRVSRKLGRNMDHGYIPAAAGILARRAVIKGQDACGEGCGLCWKTELVPPLTQKEAARVTLICTTPAECRYEGENSVGFVIADEFITNAVASATQKIEAAVQNVVDQVEAAKVIYELQTS